MRTTAIVMAKAPVAGRVKTRLCPPCTPAEAATIAEAALCDTLSAVAASGADHRLLVLDGEPGPWLPPGFDVVAQHGGGLAERLDAAWCEVDGPAVQIGMDTPQVTSALIDAALASVNSDAFDAALGLAQDGGWWVIGFATSPRGAFVGVPMSQPDTGARQLARLRALRLQVAMLPSLRDLDNYDDALAIAELLPGSRTARAMSEHPMALSA
ncbi:MAG: TIGR04282 family arsenosugar biosynthesis glycosyltransferase [Acidimicrobiales bacterium]